MHRPGVELATSRSQVRRPNHYTTEPHAAVLRAAVYNDKMELPVDGEAMMIANRNAQTAADLAIIIDASIRVASRRVASSWTSSQRPQLSITSGDDVTTMTSRRRHITDGAAVATTAAVKRGFDKDDGPSRR